MSNSLVDVIGQVIVVGLIVAASRWLFGAKSKDLPITRGDTNVYQVIWQWRAVGFSSAAFCEILSFKSRHDLTSASGWFAFIFLLVLALSGVWLATGTVSTDRNGITKRVLWYSRSFRWEDVSEVRVREKQGRMIELRAGTRKLSVDNRFVAPQHLLQEITSYTKLQPTRTFS